MKTLLVIILIIVVLSFVAYGEKPLFGFSLSSTEVCDDIKSREIPTIVDDGVEISVLKTEYTDSFKYFFSLCFLRQSSDEAADPE